MTGAPGYTAEQISRAGAELVQTDPTKMQALLGMLQQFGVATIQRLKPEQFGAFANGLRSLGRAAVREAGTMPTPEQHAVLSASSSARWLNCTASARLAEKCPRQDTAYTTAGTLAHKLAELKARKYFCGPMSQKDYRAELAIIQKDPAYDKGMDSATDLYLDHLKELTMAYDGRAVRCAGIARGLQRLGSGGLRHGGLPDYQRRQALRRGLQERRGCGCAS